MKFDKDIILGVIICAAVLLLWQPVSRYMGWDSPRTAPAASAPAAVAPVLSKDAPDTADSTRTPRQFQPLSDIPELPLQELADEKVRLLFAPSAGVLESAELLNYYKSDRETPLSIRNQGQSTDAIRHPGALGVTSAQDWQMLEVVDNHKVDDRTYQLVRRMLSPDGREFLVTQKWTLAGNYRIDYQLTLTNPNTGEPLVLKDVIVDGGDLSNWTELAGDTVRSEKHNIDFVTSDGTYDSVDVASKTFAEDLRRQARWVAVTNKYITSLLWGETPFQIYASKEHMDSLKDPNGHWVGIIGGRYPEVKLNPGESQSFNFKYFVGPKIADDLAAIEDSTLKVMHLAWGPLDWLSQLLLKILVFLHGWVDSYGLSIIILTLMVRLLFWPVTMKANRSMKRMQKLQPKIKEMREKYKDEPPQQLNARMMELYRQEKVNPFGGCLPILLQIPVFIALYQTLESAVQLRQEPFLWIHDLAAPDTIATIFGLPIHPLALAMTGLMVVQQLMTPVAMEGMQKKMMMMMPIVMLFVLYNLPSGLTLYWTVSSLFSIGQMLWQRVREDKQPPSPAPAK